MAEWVDPDAGPAGHEPVGTDNQSVSLDPDLYRALVANSPDAILLQGLDRRIEYASPATTALTGWSPHELVGRPTQEMWHPDDLAGTAAARRRLFDDDESAEPVRFRGRWLCKDGSFRWVEAVARGMRDSDGTPTRVAVLARDAEAQVRAEKEQALIQARYRLVLEGASDIVALHKTDGTLEWISPAIERQLGWTAEQRLSGDVELVHPDDVPLMTKAREHLLSGREEETARLRMLRSDGTYRWMDSTARVVRDDAGQVMAITTVTRDVHDIVIAEEALRLSEATLKATLDSLLDPHSVLRAVRDEEGRVIDFVFVEVNDAFVSQNQVRRSDVIGAALAPLLPDHLRGDLIATFGHVVESGEPLALDNQLFDPENLGRRQAQRLDIRGKRIGSDRLACTWRDVTDRSAKTQALVKSEKRFRLAMASAPEGMAVLGLDLRFLEVNPALCRLVGRDESWLLNHNVVDIIDPNDAPLDRQMRDQVLAGEAESVTQEKRLVRNDGSVIWVEHAVALLRDEDGAPMSYVSQFDDITAAREAKLELEFLASHDDLTGLITRGALLRKLDRMTHIADSNRATAAVLFIDVDRLKMINDTYGHAAGDAVLVAVANRLQTTIRENDVVGRIGGDEFVVVMPGINSLTVAGNLAERILRAFDTPIHFAGQDIEATVSIGAALADSQGSAERALWQADRALYRAKQDGRARAATWSDRGGEGLHTHGTTPR